MRRLPPTGTEAVEKAENHALKYLIYTKRGFDSPGGSQTKFLENMEIVFYIIIAAIILAIGWIVWAVIQEGRPELPNKEDEK